MTNHCRTDTSQFKILNIEYFSNMAGILLHIYHKSSVSMTSRQVYVNNQLMFLIVSHTHTPNNLTKLIFENIFY